jgi:hypothetical protein
VDGIYFKSINKIMYRRITLPSRRSAETDFLIHPRRPIITFFKPRFPFFAYTIIKIRASIIFFVLGTFMPFVGLFGPHWAWNVQNSCFPIRAGPHSLHKIESNAIYGNVWVLGPHTPRALGTNCGSARPRRGRRLGCRAGPRGADVYAFCRPTVYLLCLDGDGCRARGPPPPPRPAEDRGCTARGTLGRSRVAVAAWPVQT